MGAIADGGAPPSVLAGIRKRESRPEQIAADLAALNAGPPSLALDDDMLRGLLAERLGRFADLLNGDVPKARQVLRKILDGPIRCDLVRGADGSKSYVFEGRTKLGPL